MTNLVFPKMSLHHKQSFSDSQRTFSDYVLINALFLKKVHIVSKQLVYLLHSKLYISLYPNCEE